VTPRVGIMQGRLVPPEEGRFQSFPAQRWRDEFARARAAGLHCIEWIFDKPFEARNPIAYDACLAEMQALVAETGVAVSSICADYYMDCRLVTPSGRPDRVVQDHLLWLIERASRLGVTYIVLPFVDASSLGTHEQRAALGAALAPALPRALEHHIELHLETDLAPPDLGAVLRRLDHPALKANYDIGNSASLGYDPEEELSVIGARLGSVHVKDRLRGGGTVPLGTGSADLAAAFRMIRRIGFDRWLVLQVAREEAADHVSVARRNRETVERLWSQATTA